MDARLYGSFFTCINIYFLKQEKPEIDDFEQTKKRWFLWKNIDAKFLTDTLAKMSQNIFAYSFVSEHSKHLFEKNLVFFSRGWGGGSTPPPPLSGRVC